MKKLNVITASFLVACLFNCTILKANSANDAKLPLSGGGTVTFQQPVYINLSAIPLSTEGDYLKYEVHCTLTNSTAAPIYANFGNKGGFYSEYELSYKLDGQFIQGDSSAVIKPGNSEYVASTIVLMTKGASLIFSDLDTTSTYTVNNCYAIPHMD